MSRSSAAPTVRDRGEVAGRGWQARCLVGLVVAATALAGNTLLGATPAHADPSGLATIDVGSRPAGVAFSPDGTQAYVTNSNDNSVSVITVATAGTVKAPVRVVGGTFVQRPVLTTGPIGLGQEITLDRSTRVQSFTYARSPISAPLPVIVDTRRFAPDTPVGYGFVGFYGRDIYSRSDLLGSGSTTVHRPNNPVPVNPTVPVSGPVTVDPLDTSGFGDFYFHYDSARTVTVGGPGRIPAPVPGTDPVNVPPVPVTGPVTVGGPVNAGKVIHVGGGPTAVAFSPDGALAYVTNTWDATVSVITVATGQVSRTIPVGPGPQGVAFSPDGTQTYITNTWDATVSVITVATGQVSKTIPVGPGPQGVAFSPDGSQAYVTNTGSYVTSTNTWDATVSVITVATGQVSKTIPVGPGPQGVAFSPDGTQTYITNTWDATVSVITVATGQVSKTIPVGPGPQGVAFSPDGSQAYVTNTWDATASVITVATGQVSNRIQVGNGPTGVAVSPNGARAYVVNSYDDSVSVIAPAVSTRVGPLLP